MNVEILKYQSSLVNFLLKSIFGASLLFLCAQINIPLQPVPITLHTVGVMIIGCTYTFRNAISSVSMYILVGAVGIPVFANFNSGINIILGPAGGYIAGFLFAVGLMAKMRELCKKETLVWHLIYCGLGTLVVFVPGVLWLSKFTGLEKAITVGILPFIIPGLIKAYLTAIAVRYIKR